MTITLNHTIVPARDKRAAAQFFARIFGLRDIGAFHDLVHFERLLAERTQDIFSIMLHN